MIVLISQTSFNDVDCGPLTRRSYLISHISYLICHISAPRASEWFSWLQSAKPPLDVTKILFPSFDTSWSLTYCWPPADRAAHSEAAADWMALWRWQRFMSRCSGARRCVSRCECFFWCARPCLLVTQAQPSGTRAACCTVGRRADRGLVSRQIDAFITGKTCVPQHGAIHLQPNVRAFDRPPLLLMARSVTLSSAPPALSSGR